MNAHEFILPFQYFRCVSLLSYLPLVSYPVEIGYFLVVLVWVFFLFLYNPNIFCLSDKIKSYFSCGILRTILKLISSLAPSFNELKAVRNYSQQLEKVNCLQSGLLKGLCTLQDLLVPVFENGELLRDYTLQEVRERAELSSQDIDVMRFLSEDKP